MNNRSIISRCDVRKYSCADPIYFYVGSKISRFDVRYSRAHSHADTIELHVSTKLSITDQKKGVYCQLTTDNLCTAEMIIVQWYQEIWGKCSDAAIGWEIFGYIRPTVDCTSSVNGDIRHNMLHSQWDELEVLDSPACSTLKVIEVDVGNLDTCSIADSRQAAKQVSEQ